MKKAIVLILVVIAILVMACNSEKKHDQAQAANDSKCLVLYYSQTGVTKALAEEIQKALGADIEQIEAVEPYDGTYDETIQRCLAEQENGTVVKTQPLKSHIADYDVIFIGYPIWFGTYASPIAGVLQSEDFAGKKIVPFCTFGSGGLESSAVDLKKALPDAEILDGYGVRTARMAAMPAELSRFLIANGYVEGEVEALPEFSEQHTVEAAESEIFEAACGDYQFPLGTPVTVGSRAVEGGTEYKYTVASTNPQGEKVQATIYVLALDGAKPEFTKVVR